MAQHDEYIADLAGASVPWTPTTTTIKQDPTNLASVAAVSSSHLQQQQHSHLQHHPHHHQSHHQHQQPQQQLSSSTASHSHFSTSQPSTNMYPNFNNNSAVAAAAAAAAANVSIQQPQSNPSRPQYSNPITNQNHHPHPQHLPISSRHDPTYLTPLQSYNSLATSNPTAAAVAANGINTQNAISAAASVVTTASLKQSPVDLPRWNRPPLQPHHLDNRLIQHQSTYPISHQQQHPSLQQSSLQQSSLQQSSLQQSPLQQSSLQQHAYSTYPFPSDASTVMERALRDASPGGAVSTTTSVGPIVTPLSDADRHPGAAVPSSAAEHAINAFNMHHATAGARATLDAGPSPLGGAIAKTKQRRRYAKPKSSRYCHLCARHERAVKMFPCGNVELGICQKSVCIKCFETYGLDLAAARLPRVPATPRWTCPHCQSSCPKKAKCHSYDRQTERRRMRTRELKRQLKLKVQAHREAFSAS